MGMSLGFYVVVVWCFPDFPFYCHQSNYNVSSGGSWLSWWWIANFMAIHPVTVKNVNLIAARDRTHHTGSMDVCMKYHGNPSCSCWESSVWTKVGDQPTDTLTYPSLGPRRKHSQRYNTHHLAMLAAFLGLFLHVVKSLVTVRERSWSGLNM